ncbi:hypothetical protein E5D57_003316 [Metarhizium anisopliae]|nr:hypothetical protein E5D57_003316 [Metarhizium anisopliae]
MATATAGLNLARAALLRDSSPVEVTDIGVSPARGRTATPSSPLTRICNAAIAEGQQLDQFPTLPTPIIPEEQSPIDITEAADQSSTSKSLLTTSNFKSSGPFCEHFNEAAKQFATGPERDFAQQFSESFLGFWKKTLSNTQSASSPTYSSVAAYSNPPRTLTAATHNAQALYAHRQPAPTHRQGQPTTSAPPRDDLRVFVRLDADAPARNHIGYAIRAHVASKTGIELNRIPQVLQVNTGWAIRAIDKLTRDLLVERRAEWAEDLGATAVETSQKWYTYAVDNCPRRLTDLYGNELNYDTAARDEIWKGGMQVKKGVKVKSLVQGNSYCCTAACEASVLHQVFSFVLFQSLCRKSRVFRFAQAVPYNRAV